MNVCSGSRSALRRTNFSLRSIIRFRLLEYAAAIMLLISASVAQAAPPIVVDDGPYPVAEGDTINGTFNVLDNDTNPGPGPTMSAELVELPTFASFFDLNANGTFVYTHNGSENFADSFTYRATNGEVSVDVATVSINITPVNDPPVAVDDAPDAIAEGGTISGTFNVLANDTDAENDSLTAQLVGGPSNASAFSLNSNGTFVYTHDGSETTSDSFTYRASDGDLSNIATVAITITPANDPPVVTITAPADGLITVFGTDINFVATATDEEDGDLTAAIAWSSNVDGPLGIGGSISVSTLSVGAHTIIAAVRDSSLTSGFDSISLTITNNPPVLDPIGPQNVIEGALLSIPLSATDADGHALVFTSSALPAFCAPLTDNGNGTGSIDCSPAVGDNGAYLITVTVSDVALATDAETFTLTVGANQPPTASDVTIIGTPALGEVLTGFYTYADAEDDLEGTSTFRWLRDGLEIPGQTAITYTVTTADIETALRFEVTPVALTGALEGTPVQSPDLTISNSAPVITGQTDLETPEEVPLVVTLANLTVTDTDNVYPDDFTMAVQDGDDYTHVASTDNKSVTITPVLDFSGDLTVPVTVNDGFVDSLVFNLLITVTPVNDAPLITGLVAPLSTPEDTSLTVVVEDLVIVDPDNVFPLDFTLALQDGANYTRVDNTVTPAENFNGQISIPATVSDLEPLSSPVFIILVDVTAENDVPVLDLQIEDQNAVEASPFNLDISGNFSDADGDTLTYTASFSPALPSNPDNIVFNETTGVFSGTPELVDTEAPGPVYTVTVTAQDAAGTFASDSFDLTISARDRANLSLSANVNTISGAPGDDLQWTLTSRNPVGPQAGSGVQLNGRFVGAGLTVSGPGNCTIQAEVNQATAFSCDIGSLPVGGTNSTVFTTTTSQASEVVVFATVAGINPEPIDPNLNDNSVTEAAGVADAFSVGAVQILGSSSIRSVAAGDVNGDGVVDLVVGTSAGQGVQIFLADAERESCQCQRDFVTGAISIPDTGSNEGVALGDFNNDGRPDLVVANGGGQVDMVYLNDGSGNFAPVSPSPLGASFAQDVAVGDFNNDGNTDIAIAAVGANPVYHGNGNGGFNLHASLGNANSVGVAVAELDANGRDDLVFANVGASSRVWTKNSGAGFTSRDQLPIGDAVAVAAARLNGDARPDLVFGRVPRDTDDIPRNPVLINNGNGTFPNTPAALLGISPTNDVQIGDVNRDGSLDLVFINASGVHQIWTANGGGFTLHREQIIDGGAVAGVLADLGFTDTNNPGGIDLAMGGATLGGVAVYLNDGSGNLGRGDVEAPVITLTGNASVSIEARTNYIDAGATAADNIDGDITRSIVVSSTVNTSTVGTYSVTYNVTDFAGNAAAPVTRTVTVTPAAGSGGGGGALSYWAVVVLLVLASSAVLRRPGPLAVRRRSTNLRRRVSK